MSFLWNLLRTYHSIVWLALFGVAATMGFGIATSVTHIEPLKILTMLLVALLAGGFFANPKIPTWLAFLSLASLGIEYLLLLWAGLGTAVGGVWPALGASLTRRIDPPDQGWDWQPVLAAFSEINRGLQVLLIRAEQWAAQIGNSATIDPLIPQLIWGLAIWLTVTFLAWSIWRKQQAMLAMLPAAVVLALAAFFSGQLYNHMAGFLLCLIILQASSQGLQRQGGWRRKRLDYSESLSSDLALAVIPLAAGIVGLAFVVPTISIAEIAQTVRDILPWTASRSDAVASSFGLQPAPNPFQRAGLSGLPRSHLLGDSPALGEQLIMTIYTGELASIPYDAGETVVAPRHYWQSVVYDRYSPAGWSLTASDEVALNPADPINEAWGTGRLLRQRVERGRYATDLLHTSGLPLQVDQAAEAHYRLNGDLAVASLAERSYEATSWIFEADPDQLRAAGTDYPPDISQSYLQLPLRLPDRVRNLALDLTVTEPTPYDKALALESYLRRYPYNLEVSKPPVGADVTDYFLFELQEGYCDYYATSMVVLARAAGLPARFVIGYVSGNYDVQQAAYLVTEAEAHSWAQIYFPELGWIDFEPTAGRAAISREHDPIERRTEEVPLEDLSLIMEDQGQIIPTNPLDLLRLPQVHPFWWGLLALILLFIVANIDFWRLRLQKPAKLSETLYQRLAKQAGQIGLPTRPGDTPYEFAGNLVAYIQGEIPKSRLARFRVAGFWRLEIHPIDEPTYRGVYDLARIFVRRQYAPPERFSYDRDDLLIIWEDLGPELTRAGRILRLTRRYPKLFRRRNGRLDHDYEA